MKVRLVNDKSIGTVVAAKSAKGVTNTIKKSLLVDAINLKKYLILKIYVLNGATILLSCR